MLRWIALAVFSLSLLPLPGAAEGFSVISANGFTCSKNDELVTCRGSFPPTKNPILEATGYKVIWIRGEYPGMRYTYYSDSGCLCKADFKESGKLAQQECTSQGGHTKTFKGGKDNQAWCAKN